MATAAETLTGRLRGQLGRYDVQAASLWQEALSADAPKPGRPRLRWPGDDDDLTVKSIRDGLRQFGSGLQGLVRNVATHDLSEMSRQDGLEQLAALSLLARLIDDCELLVAEEE